MHILQWFVIRYIIGVIFKKIAGLNKFENDVRTMLWSLRSAALEGT